jgi:dipeptidyl aminopeptidase/acylaminoacyl peptidase
MELQWIADRLYALGGQEAVRPGVVGAWLAFGFDYNDFHRATSKSRNPAFFTEEWLDTGRMREQVAREAEEAGHLVTAKEMYHRAALCYATAQRRIFADTPLKRECHSLAMRAYQKVIDLANDHTIRVELPWQGKTFYGLLNKPHGNMPPSPAIGPGPFPAFVLLPGVDMVKEFFPPPHPNMFTQRKSIVLSIDSPGYGESRLAGLLQTVTSPEEAVSAAIDYLYTRSDVDKDKIGVIGISSGSYEAPRAAAFDDRIKVAVSIEGGAFYNKVKFIQQNEPGFRQNHMWMTGFEPGQEEAFYEMMSQMTLAGLEERITCPYLLLQGTHDELSPLEDAERLFNAVKGPKEMVTYKREPHALGGVMSEALRLALDWALDRLNGKPLANDGGHRRLDRR